MFNFFKKEKTFDKTRVSDLVYKSNELLKGIKKNLKDSTNAAKLVEAMEGLSNAMELMFDYIKVRERYNTINSVERWRKKLNKESLSEIKEEYWKVVDLYEVYLNYVNKIVSGEFAVEDIHSNLNNLKLLNRTMEENVLRYLIRLNNSIPFPRNEDPTRTEEIGYWMNNTTVRINRFFGDKLEAYETEFEKVMTICREVDYLQISKMVK